MEYAFSTIFHRAVLNAGRSSQEKAVVLSVCPVSPSDKRVHCDKTDESSVQIFMP